MNRQVSELTSYEQYYTNHLQDQKGDSIEANFESLMSDLFSELGSLDAYQTLV